MTGVSQTSLVETMCSAAACRHFNYTAIICWNCPHSPRVWGIAVSLICSNYAFSLWGYSVNTAETNRVLQSIQTLRWVIYTFTVQYREVKSPLTQNLESGVFLHNDCKMSHQCKYWICSNSKLFFILFLFQSSVQAVGRSVTDLLGVQFAIRQGYVYPAVVLILIKG